MTAYNHGIGGIQKVIRQTKSKDLQNKGVASAGPFYWLGSAMTKVVIDELGEKRLASIIPNGGVTFFATYFEAVNKSNKSTNIFSEAVSEYILKKM